MSSHSEIVKSISTLLYDLFVVNSGVIGMQMADGRYIPKVVHYDSLIFEKMIEKRMSLGIYQQQYKRNVTKWICLDFDCKDKDDKNIYGLVVKLVQPCINLLNEKQISYLLEFSGRRGVHVWIIFDTIISKAQAHKLVAYIKWEILSHKEIAVEYAIDIFPKISGGVNKYGSMVKCPLSWHKKGGQSFLIKDVAEFTTINIHNFEVDLEEQLTILQGYKKNKYHEVCKALEIEDNKLELHIPEYKKQYMFLNKQEYQYSLEDIERTCSNSKIFKMIFQNIRNGRLNHLDRLMLVSIFSHFDEELLRSFFELQNNYNCQKTNIYIDKYKDKYYPITMKYMYDLYNMELESDIKPSITTLEFICENLSIPPSFITEIESQIFNVSEIQKLQSIINKEISYMRYNDEVLEMVDFYQISNLKTFDLERICEICNGVMAKAECIEPRDFKSYSRIEDLNKPHRILVSLAPYDRVITSYLIFELASMVNWRFDSYSYNINFLPSGDVFFPWFHSWKRFNEAISMYINTDLFEDLSVIRVDIKKFYDNIYFHAIYQDIIDIFNHTALKPNKEEQEKVENIFKVLCKYNDKIMTDLTGHIKGVPQGPAYARIIAELFIATILKKFKESNPDVIVLRYVDDMFILHDSNHNSKDIVDKLNALLISKGLSLNSEKTRIYGEISSMREKDKLEISRMNNNYQIKTIKSLELESEEYKEESLEIFRRFIKENGDWTKDANFILNDYIENEFIEIYLDKYYRELFSSTIGRGSIFKKFYEYILNRDLWLEKLFEDKLYELIPAQSINMKCFLNTFLEIIMEDKLYGDTISVKSLIQFLLKKEDVDQFEKDIMYVIDEKWRNQV